MAETSWPSPAHNSRAVTEPEYEALVGPYAGEGLVGHPADTAPVYGDSSGRQIKVRADRYGLVRGFLWNSGTSEYTVAIGANSSGSTRIDLAVLRLDRATWTVALVVKAGTPGAGAPALTQNTGTTGTYEIPIATITVANGAATITASNVAMVGWWLRKPLIDKLAATALPAAASNSRRIFHDTDTGNDWESDGSVWRPRGIYREVQTLTGTAATVTLTPPSTCRTVEIAWTARCNDTGIVGRGIRMRINNNSGANYFAQFLSGSITTAAATVDNGVAHAYCGVLLSDAASAGNHAGGRIWITGWDDPHSGSLQWQFTNAAFNLGASSTWHVTGGGTFVTGGPYTSIVLLPDVGSFKAGSQFVCTAI